MAETAGSSMTAGSGRAAIRVTLAPATAEAGLPQMVLAPAGPPGDVSSLVLDGGATSARLERVDEVRAWLIEDDPPGRRAVLLRPLEGPTAGRRRWEVVVDGWRLEVDVEPERQAALRDRARRIGEEVVRGGPVDLRAIIPGRVVSVAVVAGDAVVAGQQLLVVEAMKMQNELRAPRDGRIQQVAVAAGETLEVGDLLLVIE